MKVWQSGQSDESVFSCHLVYQGFPIPSLLPAVNRATVGREEGLQGQSPPQRPICSSRRSYIPAAVPLVCNFSTDQERFRPFSAAGLLDNSRPGAVLGGGMDGISPSVEKLGLPVYIEGRHRRLEISRQRHPKTRLSTTRPEKTGAKKSAETSGRNGRQNCAKKARRRGRACIN